jgi:hypothetical protein
MTTDLFELPRVAHIVAELDDDFDDADGEEQLPMEPWVSPTTLAKRGLTRMHSAVQASLALVAAIVLVLASACASTGATYKSGVGDAFPDGPPYYAGVRRDVVVRDTSAIGHLPIAYQRGATQSPIFDPRNGNGSSIDVLLGEMNAYLDSLRVSERLVEGGRVSAVAHAATTTPPDVQFSCETWGNVSDGDCVERDGALGRGHLPMRLAVGRPSSEWIAWHREVMDACGVSRTLVITLEVGQYLTRQRGWRGEKEVELGTHHVAKLPWLTSLETPVSVLQLTGALVDRNGKAVRIGAEGFYARRTRLAVSAIGGQELIGDDDVKRVMTLRRDDLPGAPLAWRAALRELVSGLVGFSD